MQATISQLETSIHRTTVPLLLHDDTMKSKLTSAQSGPTSFVLNTSPHPTPMSNLHPYFPSRYWRRYPTLHPQLSRQAFQDLLRPDEYRSSSMTYRYRSNYQRQGGVRNSTSRCRSLLSYWWPCSMDTVALRACCLVMGP